MMAGGFDDYERIYLFLIFFLIYKWKCGLIQKNHKNIDQYKMFFLNILIYGQKK